MSNTKVSRVILIPGNGNATMDEFWFPYVRNELQALGLSVVAKNFPDPDLAREKFWLPFIERELQADKHSILIGHSSGGLAAMRYAETHEIFGSVLIGVNHTDLGLENEKISGYYDRPWNWQAIKDHQQWIVQFASEDDDIISIEEPRFVHEQLQTIYTEYKDRGHFLQTSFPEIIESIKNQCNL